MNLLQGQIRLKVWSEDLICSYNFEMQRKVKLPEIEPQAM